MSQYCLCPCVAVCSVNTQWKITCKFSQFSNSRKTHFLEGVGEKYFWVVNSKLHVFCLYSSFSLFSFTEMTEVELYLITIKRHNHRCSSSDLLSTRSVKWDHGTIISCPLRLLQLQTHRYICFNNFVILSPLRMAVLQSWSDHSWVKLSYVLVFCSGARSHANPQSAKRP